MIKQCKFSDSVIFFKEGFFERWNLSDYNNINDSCIFVGCYNSIDVQLINNHKGKKIVFFLGRDLPNLEKVNINNTTFASDKQTIIDIYKSKGLKFIDKIIPLKSFNYYKPVEKGNKIFCYHNNSHEGNKKNFKLEMLDKSIVYFGRDMFIFGTQGHDKQQVREWYNQSFINIQLNPVAGFTSALEMAHMGRKSISNNSAPFCIPFKNEVDIVNIIESEINNKELDKSVYGYLTTSNEWMNDK